MLDRAPLHGRFARPVVFRDVLGEPTTVISADAQITASGLIPVTR
jgi:hypothetical protein